jgi:hypothetical protein
MDKMQNLVLGLDGEIGKTAYSDLWAGWIGVVGVVRELMDVILSNAPIPMRLNCPYCHQLHEDVDEYATKPHHTHACQHCGMVWRPALVNTVGVKFLPGFKDSK